MPPEPSHHPCRPADDPLPVAAHHLGQSLGDCQRASGGVPGVLDRGDNRAVPAGRPGPVTAYSGWANCSEGIRYRTRAQERTAQAEIGALLVAETMSGCDRSMYWWPRRLRLM